MFKCPKCWDSPCVCGYEYRDRPREYRLKLAAATLGISPQLLEDFVGKFIPDEHPQHDKE